MHVCCIEALNMVREETNIIACTRAPFANATEQNAATRYTELSDTIVRVKEPNVSTLRMSRNIELL